MRWIRLALSRFKQFDGRSTRQEYWYFLLFFIAVVFVAGMIDAVIGTLDEERGIGVLSTVAMLVLLLPSIAVHIRRLHDTNRSGWFQLVAFVPLVGGLIVLVLCSLKGTEGDNRFGPPALDA